jgi:exonuclease SbcD
MIKVLHLSDIHLGSTTHGKINPTTGLNTRFEDFLAALTRCIDRAVQEPADLVLFGGDAFPDATPPPYVQQAFARQFRRLADVNIPAVLLVGNHDQHTQGQGGASLAIYRSLAVPGFTVGDRLETHLIPTAAGKIQIITLPWLNRSALLTRQETEGMSIADVDKLLLDRLAVVLEAEIRQLDPDLAAVLLAHAMVDKAAYGAERFLAAGKGFTVPLSLLHRSQLNYVALGHVHRHQVLAENPLVVYPGSIERVDFGEEKEEKGYCWLEISKTETKFEFCPLPTRPFRTLKLDVTQEVDPQAVILKAIANGNIDNAIARVIYRIQAGQLSQINEVELHQALENAHTYTIVPEVMSQESRARLPDLQIAEVLDPIAALNAYLDTRADLAELKPDLIAATQALLGISNHQPYSEEKSTEDLKEKSKIIAYEQESELSKLAETPEQTYVAKQANLINSADLLIDLAAQEFIPEATIAGLEEHSNSDRQVNLKLIVPVPDDSGLVNDDEIANSPENSEKGNKARKSSNKSTKRKGRSPKPTRSFDHAQQLTMFM